jgi:hypothetical protein
MITIPVGFYKSIAGGPSYDSDAQAFFDAVAAGGGSLSTLEKSAVNQLVIDFKDYNIWNTLWNTYPFVGSSSQACKVNLKYPSSTGTFVGGFTFNADGITSNGTSYFDTDIPVHSYNGDKFYYRYINNPGTITCGYDGSSQPGGSPYVSLGACSDLEYFDGSFAISLGGAVGTGYAQALNRTSSSSLSAWRELTAGGGTPWSEFVTSSASDSGINSSNSDYFIGTLGTVGFGNDNTTGFFSWGTSLSTNQKIQDFHTAVSTFCTTLGRNY